MPPRCIIHHSVVVQPRPLLTCCVCVARMLSRRSCCKLAATTRWGILATSAPPQQPATWTHQRSSTGALPRRVCAGADAATADHLLWHHGTLLHMMLFFFSTPIHSTHCSMCNPWLWHFNHVVSVGIEIHTLSMAESQITMYRATVSIPISLDLFRPMYHLSTIHPPILAPCLPARIVRWHKRWSDTQNVCAGLRQLKMVLKRQMRCAAFMRPCIPFMLVDHN